MAPRNRNEVVPGVADAIERRRRQVGLSPGDLALKAGVTPEGLMPLRRGYRRNYRDNLKFGLCRALGWTTDSIDLLMAGEAPRVVGDGGDDTEPTDAPGGLRIAAMAGELTPQEEAKAVAYMQGLIDSRE